MPSVCSYCGVAYSPLRQFELCQQHSTEEGGQCMHRWIADPKVPAIVSLTAEPPFMPTPAFLLAQQPFAPIPSVVPTQPILPQHTKERKDLPIYSGVVRYFPRALAYVAKISKAGNDKHNPGQPLHWSRDKSSDHPDCIARHLVDLGTVDPEDGLLHDGKLAWRALANLELKLEELEKKSHGN